MIIQRFIIGIILIASCFIFFFFSWEKQATIIPAIPERSQAQTTLSLLPNPLLISGQSGKINISIDTGANQIRFVQIQLIYDPQQLSHIKIVQGSFMQKATVLNTFINTDLGSITYIVALPKKEKAVTGNGVVASITFDTDLKQAQSTLVTFSKNTLVTNDTNPESILKKTTNTKIIKK